MYHPKAQPGDNPCGQNAGGCQHLCFGLSATQHVCKCAIGYYVDPQNPRRCLGEDSFLLYSVGHELKGLPLQIDSGAAGITRVLGPLSRISLASVVDYHAANDQLFWADNERGTITRIQRDGTDRRVIVQLDAQPPQRYEPKSPTRVSSMANGGGNADGNATAATESSSLAAEMAATAVAFGSMTTTTTTTNAFDDTSLDGLAVDWVAGNIYWSVSRRNIIEVARLDGSHPHVVLWSNVQAPRALAIDPVAGYLFYAANGRIGRIGLDGSQPFVLANRTARVTSLAVDMDAQVSGPFFRFNRPVKLSHSCRSTSHF